MRHFSAQYVFTNDGPPLQRPVISTEDDGTIVNIRDTGGVLAESHSVEFYNGIIIPGLINSHCHIEFSWLKQVKMLKPGLTGFLEGITSNRNLKAIDADKSMAEADRQMTLEGVVACADICNTSDSFELKKRSRIKYLSLIEGYGFDASISEKRIEEINSVTQMAAALNLPWYIVPHSVYSVSVPLLRQIKQLAENNKLSSIHFLESEEEKSFISAHTGPLMNAYMNILSPGGKMEPPTDHLTAIRELVTRSGNLLLVHNTAIEPAHIEGLGERNNLWYCLCPNSNIYIENKLPPVDMLLEKGCNIVIGTDSLSSNVRLSIISEMITLQQNFPGIPLGEIIRWATINGAMALGEDQWAGSIAPGKRPGLVLVKDCDLEKLRLRPESRGYRLI